MESKNKLSMYFWAKQSLPYTNTPYDEESITTFIQYRKIMTFFHKKKQFFFLFQNIYKSLM